MFEIMLRLSRCAHSLYELRRTYSKRYTINRDATNSARIGSTDIQVWSMVCRYAFLYCSMCTAERCASYRLTRRLRIKKISIFVLANIASAFHTNETCTHTATNDHLYGLSDCPATVCFYDLFFFIGRCI